MKVTINYFGQLRQKAGVESESLECSEEAALVEVVAERAEHFGADFKKIVLDEDGQIRRSIIALLNGGSVDKESAVSLKDGDEITLIPPIAGG